LIVFDSLYLLRLFAFISKLYDVVSHTLPFLI
jgi:hypothetical protein